jgi:hypothetical protein
VSFVLHALAGSVDVSLDVPASAPRVVLRLRLPRGRHATVASVAGRQIGRFDRRTETLRIPGGGHIELTAAVEG